MTFRWYPGWCLAVVMIVSLAACASSEPKNSFEMAIDGQELSIELSRDVVIGMLQDGLDTELDCDGDVDEDVQRLLSPLEKKRNASSAMGQGEERVVATRRGSTLKFVIGNSRSGHFEATVPWAVGECLLGQHTSLEKALGSKPIKVKLITDDGRTMSAKLR